eukprot:33208_1
MPAPKKKSKKKNKKKNNPNNKKKQTQQNKGKNNKQNKKNTSKQQKNAIDCQGFVHTTIGATEHDTVQSITNKIPHWAILRGSFIYLYSDKNTSNATLYDVIDVSHYVSLNDYTCDNHFVITFFKENHERLNKTKTGSLSDLCFFFKYEESARRWYRILLKTIQLTNTIKKNSSSQNNNNSNVIHNGWCLINNQLLFMELRINNKLFIYNINLSNKKKILTIKLDNYKNI